ncbi:MAG: hypothetical protein H7318_06600 [Oligoflexus sp.]|nr:hypothetical protein [Oligoflexus sp.]
MKKAYSSLVKFFFLTILVSTGACTKHTHTPTISQTEQPGACEQLNLVRDANWTSGFVKSFVNCLSDGKEGSREKFALTLSVLEKLGDNSLQATLNIFKWEYEGKEVFLGLASSFLERGASQDSAKRWAETQSLLEDTKPYAFINLMIELKKRDLLTPLLDVMESTDALLPQGFLESGVRQFLSDETVRQDSEVLIRAFLADSEAFNAFNAYLTPERRALTQDCAQDQACPYPAAGELKSSAQHWLDFWAGLSPEHREHLAQAMAQVVKGTLEQENLVALDRSNRLLALGTQTVARSSNVFTQAHEAITVLLDTPLNQYEPFIQGLNRIKDNPIYLDAFQEKIGSGTLQGMIEDFMWKGGQPKTCTQPILGLSEGRDEATRSALLAGLLKPQASCGSKVPVLVAMSEWLGYECSLSSCGMSLINDVKGSDYAQLMSYYFKRTGETLARDPWTLYRLGASRLDLTPAIWSQIVSLSQSYPLQKLDDVLAFEAKAATQFSAYLPSDWLEISLDQNLLELSSLEESFSGVFPDRDPIEQWYFSDADPKLARLVFGIYPQGPADQVSAELFSLNRLQKDWLASHPKSKVSERDLAQIVAPMRSLSSQFRNPAASFKAEAEKINLPWLGSTKYSTSFAKDGKAENTGDSLKLSLLFDETENGLGLRARYKEQLALATASFPTDEAEEFRRWMTEEWMPARMGQVESASSVQSGELPVELFDRQNLTVEESRMLPFFLGQQFVKEMNQAPTNTLVSQSPETNINPKAQAARTFSGPSALGGSEHPWTSFWLAKNDSLNPKYPTLQAMRDSIANDAAALQSDFVPQSTSPVLISQGLLDTADADKLNDHQKLLLQLHLMSPIFENRGKQFFVPAVSFANYCPQKNGQNWQAAACPFQFSDFAKYRSFVQNRFSTSLCSMISDATSPEVLASMGLSESPAAVKQFCAAYPSTLRWSKPWLQSTLSNAIRMGKNPKLRASLKGIPADLRWAKAQHSNNPKQIVKAFLSHTPVLDGLTSSKVLQRSGNYQAFFSNLPGASSVWLLYLSQGIGLRGISDSLKRLGGSPVAGSEKPIEDFLNLITVSYEDAKAKNQTTLMFGIGLLTEIAKRPYARETVVGLLGKPYDPYAGVLIGYTLPQAVKAGILPEFSWATYAPLRLLLQSQNLYLLQGLAEMYDRDALDWFDVWTLIVEQFPSVEIMASDMKPLLNWLRAYLKSTEATTAPELSKLLVLRDWQPAMESATRQYRLLRVSLPDLSNKAHDPFYFESPALSRAVLESLPRLLALKDRYELAGGDKNLMADAFLGMIQGPLKHDGKEAAAWLQDNRMGFRAPSFLAAALRDKVWREQLNASIEGLSLTNHEEWKNLREEWNVLGPHSFKLIDYMAKNVVLHNDKAQFEKQGLETLAKVTGDEARWRDTQKVLESWLDEKSVLKEWQDQQQEIKR